jgi:hypothetical protein
VLTAQVHFSTVHFSEVLPIVPAPVSNP